MVNKAHRNVSPHKGNGFGPWGRPSASGETGTSKRASKVPLGNKSNSPQLGISIGATLVGLRVSQLKMDMPLIFTTSKQQNVRGWLMKME